MVEVPVPGSSSGGGGGSGLPGSGGAAVGSPPAPRVLVRKRSDRLPHRGGGGMMGGPGMEVAYGMAGANGQYRCAGRGSAARLADLMGGVAWAGEGRLELGWRIGVGKSRADAPCSAALAVRWSTSEGSSEVCRWEGAEGRAEASTGW